MTHPPRLAESQVSRTLIQLICGPQGCVPAGYRCACQTKTVDTKLITAVGVFDTFLILLIGVGPKIAIVPFVQITAALDPDSQKQVRRRMIATAAVVALALILVGEALRVLLHFSVGALAIAGGVILFVLAVPTVLGQPSMTTTLDADKTTLQLAQVPLAVPYLLNPVGIVGLVTLAAAARSISVLAIEIGLLLLVLLIDVVVFRVANRLGGRPDQDRMAIVERVFGFLIAAIAVQLVLTGLFLAGIIGPIHH
jgi:multiple antibiotic resistance protein